MNYGELIGDAFRITLRNRYLWFFGFFAGGGTSFNVPTNVPSGGNFNPDDFQQSSTMLSAVQVGQGLGNGIIIAGLVVVALILALFFIFMAIVSQGALVDSVAAIDRGDRRGFGSAFRSGLGNFWRVLGYIVVFILIAIGLLLVIGIPVAILIGGTFAATQSVGARIAVAVVVGLVAFLALIVVFVPLSIIGQYALREIVVRRNIGRSLLILLIQVGLSIGIAIVFILAVLIVGLVLAIPAIALAVAGLTMGAWIAGGIALLIFIPLFLVATGAIGTFSHAYWTLAYLRLTAPPRVPPATPQGPFPTTG